MISMHLIALLALAASLPLSKATEFDVWAPPITQPNASTVWYTEFNETVKWDASNPPSNITNTLGKVYLVKDGIIELDHPLASNFSITDGQVDVTVPYVSTGFYQVVLFGDSGNLSPNFSIIDLQPPED